MGNKLKLKIIKQYGIRVVMMPGLLKDDLDEDNIKKEINFWKALDVDYQKLRNETDALISRLEDCLEMIISNNNTSLRIGIKSVFGEYGSFGNSKYQSNTINLPGGF